MLKKVGLCSIAQHGCFYAGRVGLEGECYHWRGQDLSRSFVMRKGGSHIGVQQGCYHARRVGHRRASGLDRGPGTVKVY